MKNNQARFAFKTQTREALFQAYVDDKLDMDDIISRLAISRRQFYRLRKKFIQNGSLAHGLCNKRSNRSIDMLTKNNVLLLYKNYYSGFNYEHASELLIERNKIEVSSSTLRRWLLDAGLTAAKRRNPKKYTRRIPKTGFNDMLQLDGTFYDFLGNGTLQCLMHLVDDATKTSMAYLYDAECTQSALDILYKWCCKYGLPKSIYSDRHSTYKVNERQHLTLEEELENKTFRITEFGNVCNKLNIQQIFAYSPQAKGRVERKHQMYQDRFFKELGLLGICTREAANDFLIRENGFCDKLNAKFTISAKDARTVDIVRTPTELAQYFTIDTTRTVRNDYTISYKGDVLQLTRSSVVNARHKVIVKLYLDGTLKVQSGNQIIDYKIVENYVKPEIKKERNVSNSLAVTIASKNTSPWRNFIAKEKKYKQASSSAQLDKIAVYYG